MMKKIHNYIFIFFISFVTPSSFADDAPIIQPGAPGENSKILDPEIASNIAGSSYVQADIDFLNGMIVHHNQAIFLSLIHI